MDTQSLAWLLGRLLEWVHHAILSLSLQSCHAAAARMSRSNNSFDLGTLALELGWKELPDEIEEWLSTLGQVEGDWVTMHNRTAIRCGTEQHV